MALGQGALLSMSVGQLGSTYIADTNAHTGDFGIIHALTSAVINTLVSGTRTDGTTCMLGTLTNITLPSGVAIYGRFSSVKLDSGTVVAYNI